MSMPSQNNSVNMQTYSETPKNNQPLIPQGAPLTRKKDKAYYKALLTVTVLLNKYIPHAPHPPQAKFLITEAKEAFYGGAAGGGKSDALLMCALQYIDVPNYAALILRKTYKDLSLPGAIMDRCHTWLMGTDAKWNGDTYTWHFPSGATLTFGYLESEKDKYRYQGAEFQCICFDELTQFTITQYKYLMSRLRRLAGSCIPIRMRSAANPGGVGHEWVKQRFIVEGAIKGRPFIPAKLDDNPSLDREQYLESLNELDPVTRAQLRDGDWSAGVRGEYFKREWFKIVEEFPKECKIVRYWDFAATEPKEGKDPDWSTGFKIGEYKGQYWNIDVQHFRKNPKGVEDKVKETAELDGKSVEIHIEQEPGSSGVIVIDHYQRTVLKGYAVYGHKVTGSKLDRAKPASAASENGNVFLVRGTWINDWFDEIELFGTESCVHDDQVDGFSGAFNRVTKVMKKVPSIVVPQMSRWT